MSATLSEKPQHTISTFRPCPRYILYLMQYITFTLRASPYQSSWGKKTKDEKVQYRGEAG
jgi:hypothetical protein